MEVTSRYALAKGDPDLVEERVASKQFTWNRLLTESDFAGKSRSEDFQIYLVDPTYQSPSYTTQNHTTTGHKIKAYELSPGSIKEGILRTGIDDGYKVFFAGWAN